MEPGLQQARQISYIGSCHLRGMREVAQPKAPVRPLKDIGRTYGAMDDAAVV
jgi:hypothetical protein